METLTIFGEVLFDCFPSGERVLGGAPFNVAWHLRAFGRHPRFVSRVGEDAAGQEVRRAMQEWGMDRVCLQQDPHRPTGEVRVHLHRGEPSYEIVDGVAYDFIDPAALVGCGGGLLYHGSLCLRHDLSRAALEHLKEQGPGLVFLDVNLRPPWWERESLLHWCDGADWVKLNEAELRELHGTSGDLQEAALAFFERHALQGLVVTRGERGALGIGAEHRPVTVAPVQALEVVDSVGAGDALAAVLLLGLELDWPLELSLERAQSFASALVGRRGATVGDAGFYRPFLVAWGLA
jgi:fructokinase